MLNPDYNYFNSLQLKAVQHICVYIVNFIAFLYKLKTHPKRNYALKSVNRIYYTEMFYGTKIESCISLHYSCGTTLQVKALNILQHTQLP